VSFTFNVCFYFLREKKRNRLAFPARAMPLHKHRPRATQIQYGKTTKYAQTCIPTHTYAYPRTHMPTQLTHPHASPGYIHTHAYTHTHTYTHIQVPRCTHTYVYTSIQNTHIQYNVYAHSNIPKQHTHTESQYGLDDMEEQPEIDLTGRNFAIQCVGRVIVSRGSS
jgi:hypothetical protein